MNAKQLLSRGATAALLTFATFGPAQTFDELFTEIDADSNGILSAEEMREHVYSIFDTDANNTISEAEYDDAIGRIYPDGFETTFAELDSDGDGSLNQDEFATLYDSSLYSAFDADGDGEVTQVEFSETMEGQEVVVVQTTAVYVPYGEVEVGEYEAIDNAERGELLVRTVSPSDQAVDVVLIGPYGYKNVLEVQAEQVVEDIPAGTYVVAATDDNLEMVSTKVDVREGQRLPVTLTLNAIDTTDYNPAYEPYSFFDFDYEVIDSPDCGELNILFDYAQDFQPSGLVGTVVGPDDYREDIDGDTETLELDGLVPGDYQIAVSTQGGDLAEGIVEVRAGEAANVTMTLSGITPTQ
jgi:hypothetical protein